MEPSKEYDSRYASVDGYLALEARTKELEKQVEFCFTVFNLILLAGVLYLTYPYLFPLVEGKEIPGVQT